MQWCKKDGKGECLPTLRALLTRARQPRVRVELLGGLSFIDEVMSVDEAGPQPVAVFASRRVAVADISLIDVTELA